jgi:catechol 2,3-dioxygenase-like lactoylglutathione lyase family enzyme
MYYQIPGNGEMSHALGFFQEGGDSVRTEQDRVFLTGVMCDDLEKTMADISGRGLKFVHDEPQRYAVGSSNTLGTLHGLEIFIAKHVPGGDRKAREMMFTKDGSSDFGDDTQGSLFLGISGIDLAVADLDAAIATYSAVFGTAPANTTARTDEAGVCSAHFPAPGNGRGVREFGLFAVDPTQAPGRFAQRLADVVKSRGEGVFRLDCLVTDLDAIRATLAARGIELPGDAVLEDINGADLRFIAA